MSIGHLFLIDHDSEHSLQKQIVEQIGRAIMAGSLPLTEPLPSSRALAKQLGVGRNTVILAYEKLVADGFLITRERAGYYVNPHILEGMARREADATEQRHGPAPQWDNYLKLRPSGQRNIEKPGNWKSYRYPFIYGQISDSLFPLHNWRECCRDAISPKAVARWSEDRSQGDDPLLVEQICTRLLPRRGIMVKPEEVLVTVGAQHALFLVAQLLADAETVIGVENPGYVDVRNIFALTRARLQPLEVDTQGLVVDERLGDCQLLYVTPSHQSPTTVTMPMARRHALLEQARRTGALIIEDDYESEFNYSGTPLPALKSLDTEGRVIYVGSLSKTIAPGLRMGFIAAPTALIGELRALRRLMIRYPAANNQHSLALFLARGYHDALISNLLAAYRGRHAAMLKALADSLPSCTPSPSQGGSSFWMRGPDDLDATALARRAAELGVLIEPGDIYFQQDNPPMNYFRLGFSAIDAADVLPGIAQLAEALDRRTNIA